MNNNLLQENQEKVELFTERSVSFHEIKEIHQGLLNQELVVSENIIEAIESNDYVKLTHLTIDRSKIQTAIKELESLHGEELNTHVSLNDRIVSALKDAATTIETRGEDILIKGGNHFEKLSQSAHSMIIKAIAVSNESFSKGNQFNLKTGKYLVNKTATSLTKLAETIRKR